MWLILYIRNVFNLYLQLLTLRFKCVQKIHSRINVLIKGTAFIVWKPFFFFFPSSASYEDLFLILKIKFFSQFFSSELPCSVSNWWFASGGLSPVCPAQEGYWWLERAQRRPQGGRTRRTGRGLGMSAFLDQEESWMCFYSFLHLTSGGHKRRKIQTRLWGAQQEDFEVKAVIPVRGILVKYK